MRVLAVALNQPAATMRNGYDLHVHHLLAGLAGRHDIHVLVPGAAGPDSRLPVTWHSPGDDDDQAAGLDLVTRRLRPQAASIATTLARLVEEWRPEIVHVISDKLAPLGRVLAGVPSVLGALDAAHLNARAAASVSTRAAPRQWLRYAATARLIRHDYPRFGQVTVVTDEDALELTRLVPDLPVTVIPNGVDVARFAAAPGSRRDPGLIVFTGALDYPPNVDAARYLAREIFPRVRQQLPNTRLQLVGRDPAPAVWQLATGDGVEVCANVPDIADHLSRAAVFVCPMRTGTGIKNKLLEAMANGVPAVVTSLALQGIDAHLERDVLAGDSPAALAAATVRLLSDPTLRQQVGEAGRRLVADRYTWDAVSDAYSTLYDTVAGRR